MVNWEGCGTKEHQWGAARFLRDWLQTFTESHKVPGPKEAVLGGRGTAMYYQNHLCSFDKNLSSLLQACWLLNLRMKV